MSQERLIKSFSEVKLNENSANDIDLDTLLQNDHGRKLFALYLKDLNNSSDNILTLYLICCCFQNNQRIEDRQRIKQILEKTYNACFIKNELPQLNFDLKQKLCESLQKTIYNEAIFNAVKKELKLILESDYYPKFLNSKIFRDNQNLIFNNKTQITTTTTNATVVDNAKTKDSQNILDDFLEAKNRKETKSSSNFFAMPSIPMLKKAANINHNSNAGVLLVDGSSRVLKHSKSSTSSSASSIVSGTGSTISKKSSSRFNGLAASSKNNKSTNELGSSTQSTNSGTSSKSKKLKQFPPNPYHVMTAALPVSAQDSELQSVVSGDVHFEDCDNKIFRKMDNTRVEDVSLINGTQNISINSKQNSKQSKFNKQIKESINANKNAKIDLPHSNVDVILQQNKDNTENHNKKNQMPISESDPKKFFEILSAKLNKVLEEQNENEKPLKIKSFSNSHLPIYLHNYGGENDHEEVEEDFVEEEEDEPNILPAIPNSKINKDNFSFNCRHLLKNVESDIDVQLEEHLDRVYNNDQHQLKENNPKFRNNDTSSKMSVKASSTSLSNVDKSKHKLNKNDSINEINRHSIHNHHDSSHNSSKFLFKTNNLSSNSFTTSSKSTVSNNIYNNNSTSSQHHFYKLTSTSKEVDIDSQNYSSHNKSHTYSLKKNDHLNDSNISYNNINKNLKNVSTNHTHKTSNHNESNSYDRVNDWLSSGFQEQQQLLDKNAELENLKKPITSTDQECDNIKTTVAYYLPGEDLAYISTYNGKYLTLAQFKQLITKKGNFRYFFKTKSDLLGDECVVYQEANDENSNVPMFNNKVIAKIEKIIN